MKCQRCNSERVASVNAHHEDRFNMSCEADDLNVDCDYAPYIDGLCGGDDTRFNVCLDCGQMQGEFPKPKVIS